MLLRAEKLTKDYGRFRALDHLDLAIAPGEIVGILGPNGSGKSTALRLMLGFLRPTLGRCEIAGHDCWEHGPRARQHVAYLPGELRLYENMTGRRLVEFLGRLRHHGTEANVERLAKAFDIDLDRRLTQLSSGMKRKVALLQVLVAGMPLLILDEPTNTLDPSMRDQLLEQLVAAKKRGQAVLFSSHVLTEVERVCDRVAILQRGRLVHVQAMAQLQQIRRIQVSFTAELARLPTLAGLELRSSHPPHYEFEHAGPLQEFLQWLGPQAVVDMQICPNGLAGIYHRYHGTEA